MLVVGHPFIGLLAGYLRITAVLTFLRLLHQICPQSNRRKFLNKLMS